MMDKTPQYRYLTSNTTMLASIVAIVALGALDMALQPWLMRREAIRIWDAAMLEGVSGYYSGGRTFTITPLHPSTKSDLSVVGASFSDRGIVVHDLTGPGGGGWDIAGGPVSELSTDSSQMQLYARQVLRYHPGWWNNYVDYSENVYDFFLVKRTPSQVPIVKSWLNLKQDAYDSTTGQYEYLAPNKSVRGTLRYDTNSGRLQVQIINITHPITENITL